MGRPKTGREVKCETCGKKLYVPNFKLNQKHFYCSYDCLHKNRPTPWNKGLTKKDDKRLKSISEKTKEQMKREYEDGTRDRYKITQKAHEAVVKKSQERFKENPNKTISKRGYYEIYIPQVGWKKEHHIIWEKHKGKIPKEAIIHHINGNPLDNRIENLMMFPNNAAHMAYHYKERKKNSKGQFESKE